MDCRRLPLRNVSLLWYIYIINVCLRFIDEPSIQKRVLDRVISQFDANILVILREIETGTICKMYILMEGFFLLSCTGIWRPINWTSRSKVFLYGVYNTFMLISFYAFATGQILYFFFYVRDLAAFSDVALTLIAFIMIACKSTTIIIRREDIIKLSQRFFKYPMKPMNIQEEEIELPFTNFARKIIISFAIVAFLADTALIIQSAFMVRDGNLVAPCWYPYSLSKRSLLAFSWLHQAICIFNGGMMSGCCDTIFSGFLLKVCSQLEILKLRFHQVTQKQYDDHLDKNYIFEEKKRLITCIRHHIHICKFSTDLNHIFAPILFVQFFTSVLILCSLIRSISIMKPSMELIPILICILTILLQIFFYCWFGNEVISSSLDLATMVYTMDWTALTLQRQKDLIFILLRIKTPIKITSSFLVTLSTQSFISILQAAFSLFNLIKNTRNNNN
ncbi:odorant receptor 67c-like isoform X2 [Prorops nasuta]|uniref:odorant receptor 67c-like isoform X2 n=1 Tax=Prorops nasuta TaxID=863751 RepID=UPI0034CD5800